MGGCTSKSSQTEEFIADCLRTHNELRSRHGVPPLRVHKGLNKMASKWAVHISKLGHMEHSKDQRFKGGAVGENIHWKSFASSDPRLVREKKVTGAEAAESWYNEIRDPGYNFANPGFKKGTGHFTQLVWKESTMVGFGIARVQSKENEVQFYVVANYYPAGNVNTTDYFRENVLPPNRR